MGNSGLGGLIGLGVGVYVADKVLNKGRIFNGTKKRRKTKTKKRK